MRKPVDEDAKAGRADGRQMLWEAIRKLHASEGQFTVTELVGLTQSHRKTTLDYLKCLIAGGYMSRIDGDAGAGIYTLEKDAGHHAPRLRADGTAVAMGGGVRNIWRSMQMLPSFSVIDLALHATTPSVTVTQETAQAYCHMLLSTGFLRVVQKAEPTKGRKAVYRLIRNSGPKPPMIQRVKQVFDPNTGTVYRKGGAQ